MSNWERQLIPTFKPITDSQPNKHSGFKTRDYILVKKRSRDNSWEKMNKKSFRFSKTNHSQNTKLRNNKSLAKEVLFRHTYKSGHLSIQKALIPKFCKWVRRQAVVYIARMKHSRRLVTSRVREVHTGLKSKMRTLGVLTGYIRLQCKNAWN